MSRKHLQHTLVLLLVLMAAAFVLPAVAAQTVDTIELVGVVENMTANSITVNQQVVDVSTAQINTPIEIGAVVKVQGILAADGSIVAREVNAAENGILPGEVEITGTLESFSGTTMVVGGQTIDVSTAQIGTGVALGQMVKVHATATGANSWQAREVSLFVAPPESTPDPSSPVGEFEITGTLQQIGNGFIVVSGQTISIAGAEIKNSLLVGVLVKAHVSLVNGALVAREVENAVASNDNANANDNNANANDNNANANDNNVNANNVNANDNNVNANDNNVNANDNNSAAVVTMEEAIAKVLAIYPNTTIASIELTTKFGDRLVWEVKTANRVEVNIDAITGVILTIDQPGSGGGSGNGGDDNLNNNANNNDNNNANNNDNNNANANGNDNGDDSGGMGGDSSGGSEGMG